MVQEKLVSSEKTKTDDNVNHDEPQLRFKEFSEPYKEVLLGDISSNCMYGMNCAAKEYDGENKYIRITDIDENSHNFVPNPLSSPDGNLEDKFLLKENDIVFARTGASTGKSYLYNKNDGKLYFAGFLIRLEINGAHAPFVYYNTLRENYNNWVSVMSVRSGQPGINLEEYKKFKINLPSLEEQKKIASFLSVIDKKIELLEKKHETYEKFYISVLNKIFKKELSFSTSNTWKEATLGELGVFFRGHSYNSSNVVNEGLVVLRSNNIQNSKLIFEKDQLQQVNKDCKEEIKLLKNDIVICMSNGTKSLVGKSAMYEGNFNKELTVGAFCSIFRSSFPLSKYLLKTSLYKRNLYLILAGTNINNLKNEDMKKFKFEIPTDAEEINKIDGFLKNLENNLNKINYELSSIKNFKAGLLQKMFV